MNKIIISVLIVLVILFYLCKLSFFEGLVNFRNYLNFDDEMNLFSYHDRKKFDDNLYYPLVNPKMKYNNNPKPFDQIKCWDNLYLSDNTHVGWSKKRPATRYTRRNYGDFKRECDSIKKYGSHEQGEIDNKSYAILYSRNRDRLGEVRRLFKLAPFYYNRKHWNGNFYNDPENLMNGCCKFWKEIYNDVAERPCLQKTEMSRYCDFYSNHIYKNNRWEKINRSKGERSECDRVPILKTVCCHSCSI